MEKRHEENSRGVMGIIILIYLLITCAVLIAEEKPCNKKQENNVKTLLNGINSNNTGVRKSSIYFAGKYKIEAAVDVLSEQLVEEKDESIKYLIVMSLAKIGSPKSFAVIKNMSEKDKSAKFKNIGCQIVKEYCSDTNYISLSKTK